jgi:Fe-S cluster assembly iron-binding protein IscA
MSLFQVDSQTVRAIQRFLAGQGLAYCVRVEIRSSGCCDAGLGLVAEEAADTDMVEHHDSLQIAIPPEIYQRVGCIAISCSAEEAPQDFFLTPDRPLNEWSGFAPCSISLRP